MLQWKDVQSYFKAWQRHSLGYNKVGLWKVLHTVCSLQLSPSFPPFPKANIYTRGERRRWQPKIMKKPSGNSMGIAYRMHRERRWMWASNWRQMSLLYYIAYRSVGAFSTKSEVSIKSSHYTSCFLINKQNDRTDCFSMDHSLQKNVMWNERGSSPWYCTACTKSNYAYEVLRNWKAHFHPYLLTSPAQSQCRRNICTGNMLTLFIGE